MPPKLTAKQRTQGAAKSLEVRKARMLVKLALSQRVPLERYWTNETARCMKVSDLLQAMPGIGARRAASLLARAGIPEKNTVKACGPKQTERLFELL